MRFPVLAALCGAALLLVSTACSDGGSNGNEETTPAALTVCKIAGDEVCGVTQDGKTDALLVCEVTEEYGRVWVLVEECPAGCAEAACNPVPQPDVTGDLVADAEAPDVVEVDLPPACEPQCEGKACGDDGCDGSCGLCPTDHLCGEDFQCHLHCAPMCAGKQCGDDGCGGSCGTCPFNMACQDGLCACNPQCTDKDCGPDGCGGSCGTCPEGTQCSPFGQCEELCQPACEDKQCGPDGCGGTCGACAPGLFCSPDGECTDQCYPMCANKQCGPDGCGGLCGMCPCLTCADSETECNPDGLCVEPGGSGLGCNDLILCLNDCVSGDASCQTACFDSATPLAQTQYEDLINCIVAKCGSSPSDACVQDSLLGFCAQQYNDCIFN